MKIEQVLPRQLQSVQQPRTALSVLVQVALRLMLLAVITLALGRAALPAKTERMHAFSLAVAGHTFDLLQWETAALSDKWEALLDRPAAAFTEVEGARAVQSYLAQAGRIGEIEAQLRRHASETALSPNGPHASIAQAPPAPTLRDADVMRLRAELNRRRMNQAAMRPAVEQIIQRQVGAELLAAGFGGEQRVWPPVQFAFSEPPKKLVVSRRDRIETIYSRMLEAEIELDEIEEAEAEIAERPNASAYITNIGGLGAFPTMVIDRASLSWILSTVAHEWVHNYLIFHPLGWNYFASQELTTMNETVAEIVGNKIGKRVLARYYPEMVTPPILDAPADDAKPSGVPPPEEQPPGAVSPPGEEPEFDFRAEMRATRLRVDELLAKGEVAAAEAYMDERRLVFVANGYPLRVLNQAYFAFHGSYVTSPASTSPIGPKLIALAEQVGDLKAFMQTVRSFTSIEDLESALDMYGVQVDPN